MLHVHPKTVARWARRGQLMAVVTPGGHRRFSLGVVLAFLREMGFDDQARLPRCAASGDVFDRLNFPLLECHVTVTV